MNIINIIILTAGLVKFAAAASKAQSCKVSLFSELADSVYRIQVQLQVSIESACVKMQAL